jgi:hypothetical protein
LKGDIKMMNINEIKKEFKPDNEAQEAIWVHACLPHNMQKLISNINNNPEICASKIGDRQYFHNTGFFIKGEVTLMAKFDIGSKYDPVTRERSFYTKELKPENIGKVLTKEYKNLKPIEGSYTESFVKIKEIVGIWIYDFYIKRLIGREKVEFYKIANSLGLTVQIISINK